MSPHCAISRRYRVQRPHSWFRVPHIPTPSPNYTKPSFSVGVWTQPTPLYPPMQGYITYILPCVDILPSSVSPFIIYAVLFPSRHIPYSSIIYPKPRAYTDPRSFSVLFVSSNISPRTVTIYPRHQVPDRHASIHESSRLLGSIFQGNRTRGAQSVRSSRRILLASVHFLPSLQSSTPDSYPCPAVRVEDMWKTTFSSACETRTDTLEDNSWTYRHCCCGIMGVGFMAVKGREV